MASRCVAHGETVAAFIPELERLIAEAMEEWKVPGLAIAVVQKKRGGARQGLWPSRCRSRLEADNR